MIKIQFSHLLLQSLLHYTKKIAQAQKLRKLCESKIKKPIISFRGIPENQNNEPFIFDMEDEITRETLVMRDGQVVHPRIRESDSEGGH